VIDDKDCFIFIALFPVMLYLYRNVTNNLVALGISQANITAASVISTNGREWYIYIFYYFILINNNVVLL
jgi:hypothetical protein